tara:strand:+ start:764 stop:946 length:183 start_codon:yes stop_codon:yes gene_type:complete
VKVGDLVKDISTGDVVIIIKENPVYIDTDGQHHVWDFEVMCGDSVYSIDKDEIGAINESR